MSTTFSIKNADNMPSISFKEALKIDENISQYILDEEDERAEQFLSAPLERFESIHLGEEKKSCRGFQLWYDTDTQTYNIRLFTPCGLGDWEAAFSYMKKLGAYLRADTVADDEGKIYQLENITDYPYKENILYGIKSNLHAFQEHDLEQVEIFGIYRPVAINRDMLQKFLESSDPVQSFSNFITSVQYLDAFTASQRFYDMDGELCGVYTLTEDVRTILPYRPSVSYDNSERFKDEDVKKWKIMLVIINGDPNNQDSYQLLGNMDYAKFIQKLPKDKYSFIDAAKIMVEPLTQQEIKAIFA